VIESVVGVSPVVPLAVGVSVICTMSPIVVPAVAVEVEVEVVRVELKGESET
jgi:hypothetical protein